MPLQSSWVEHLFAKLTVRYGAAFMRQYDGLDPEMVKADWAEVLDGASGHSLSYAMRFLPERAPNAVQFRNLCRSAPASDAAALPPPTERADPARVAAIMARARQGTDPSISLAEKCGRNILRIVAERGGRISIPQRQQLEAMVGLMQPETVALAARYVPSMAARLARDAEAA